MWKRNSNSREEPNQWPIKRPLKTKNQANYAAPRINNQGPVSNYNGSNEPIMKLPIKTPIERAPLVKSLQIANDFKIDFEVKESTLGGSMNGQNNNRLTEIEAVCFNHGPQSFCRIGYDDMAIVEDGVERYSASGSQEPVYQAKSKNNVYSTPEVVVCEGNYFFLVEGVGVWVKSARNVDRRPPRMFCQGKISRIKQGLDGRALLALKEDMSLVVIPLASDKSFNIKPSVNGSKVLDFASIGQNTILVLHTNGAISAHLFNLQTVQLIASNTTNLTNNPTRIFGRGNLVFSQNTGSPLIAAFLVDEFGFTGREDKTAAVFHLDEASLSLKKLFLETREDKDYNGISGRAVFFLEHRDEHLVVADVDYRQTVNTGSALVQTKVHHFDLKRKEWKTVKSGFFNFGMMGGLAQDGQGFGTDVVICSTKGEVKVAKHHFIG